MTASSAAGFSLCTEKSRLLAAISAAVRPENLLYAARLEQLLSGCGKELRGPLRFYLISDRKGRRSVLGFSGNIGIFLAAKGFSFRQTASFFHLLTGANDVLIAARGEGRRLSFFLPPGAYSLAAGDNFRLFPKQNASGAAMPPAGLLFRSALPVEKEISAYFDLFSTGFPGFATRTEKAFYYEQSHLLRHGIAALSGLYQNGLPVCGCAVSLGSKRLRYLYDLATLPAKRRAGLGSTLLFLIAEKDPRPLWLSAQDKKLSKWYRSLGFLPAGHWMQLRRKS